MTIEFMRDLLSKDEKIKKGDVRGGDNVIYYQYHVASAPFGGRI